MERFKAFRVHTVDGKSVCKFEQLSMDDIDPGPVVIRTAFSAITYKDAMAARGVGKNVRTDRPCVTGVDLSGVVIESEDDRFKEGDEVAVKFDLHSPAAHGAQCVLLRCAAETIDANYARAQVG